MADDHPAIVYEQPPCAALKPFVRRFLVVEFPRSHRDEHLPDLGAVAAFSFRGRCLLPGAKVAPPAAFTGIYDKVRVHHHEGGHSVLIASFTSAGAGALLRVPMEALAGLTENLHELLPEAGEIDGMLERMSSVPGHASRVALAETFLLGRLSGRAPDPLIDAAVRRIVSAELPVRVNELAAEIGLSQSALERRFRKTVGVTPKRYISLQRLRRAEEMGRAGEQDLISTAYAVGYYDQSHFIHDFRRTTGRTPQAYFKSARETSPRCGAARAG